MCAQVGSLITLVCSSLSSVFVTSYIHFLHSFPTFSTLCRFDGCGGYTFQNVLEEGDAVVV